MSSSRGERQGGGHLKLGWKPEGNSREEASTSQEKEAADREVFNVSMGQTLQWQSPSPLAKTLEGRKETHKPRACVLQEDIWTLDHDRAWRRKARELACSAAAWPSAAQAMGGQGQGTPPALRIVNTQSCFVGRVLVATGSRRTKFPRPNSSSFHLPWWRLSHLSTRSS